MFFTKLASRCRPVSCVPVAASWWDSKDGQSLLQESGGGVPSYRCLVAKPLVLPVDTPYLKDTG